VHSVWRSGASVCESAEGSRLVRSTRAGGKRYLHIYEVLPVEVLCVEVATCARMMARRASLVVVSVPVPQFAYARAL
jgi:hypothetical protein